MVLLHKDDIQLNFLNEELCVKFCNMYHRTRKCPHRRMLWGQIGKKSLLHTSLNTKNGEVDPAKQY